MPIKSVELYNPFKGPIPYLKGERIYERDNETKKLFDLVTSNTLTILYSKSGFGKTSLIQAGLMPLLEENLIYLPVYIRLNTVDVGSIDALQDLIIERIKEVQHDKKNTEKYTIRYDSEKVSNCQSLFEFLYLLDLQLIETLSPDKDSDVPEKVPVRSIVPVLIFDQFEEIFTILAEKESFRDELILDLECLLENKIHSSLAQRLNSEFKDDKPFLFKLTERIASREKPFRIIISFREEFRLQFDRLAYKIPTINFTNARLELGAFTKAEAKNLILEISKASIPIDDKIAIKLANILQLTSERDDMFNNSKNISPFLLSLICFRSYAKIIDRDPATLRKIDNVDPELTENLVEEYYAEVFSACTSETEEFIQDNLIKGKNRTPFPYKSVPGAIKKEIDMLSGFAEDNHIERLDLFKKRYLHKSQYLSEPYVEILHDQLVPPIYNRKVKRDAERKRREEKDKARVYNLKRYFLIAAVFLTLIIIVAKVVPEFKTVTFLLSTTRYKEPQVLDHLENNYGTYFSFMEALGYDSLVDASLSSSIIDKLDIGGSQVLHSAVDSFVNTQFDRQLYYTIDTINSENKFAGQIASSNSRFICTINIDGSAVKVTKMQSMQTDTVLRIHVKPDAGPALEMGFYGMLSKRSGYSGSVLVGEKVIAVKSNKFLFFYNFDTRHLDSVQISWGDNARLLNFFANEQALLISNEPLQVQGLVNSPERKSTILFLDTTKKIMHFSLPQRATILTIARADHDGAVIFSEIQSGASIFSLLKTTVQNAGQITTTESNYITPGFDDIRGIGLSDNIGEQRLSGTPDKTTFLPQEVAYKSSDENYLFRKNFKSSHWNILDLQQNVLLKETLPGIIERPLALIKSNDKRAEYLLIDNKFRIIGLRKGKKIFEDSIPGFTKNNTQWKTLRSISKTNVANYLLVSYNTTGINAQNNLIKRFVGLLKVGEKGIKWIDLGESKSFEPKIYSGPSGDPKINVDVKNDAFAILSRSDNNSYTTPLEMVIWLFNKPSRTGLRKSDIIKWNKEQLANLGVLAPSHRKMDSLKIQYRGFKILE